MRSGYIVLCVLLFSVMCVAQDSGAAHSAGLAFMGTARSSHRDIGLSTFSATLLRQVPPGDSVQYNMYGDLREDDPEFNQKAPLWSCAIRVAMNNVGTWAVDRYVFNADYARISPETWKTNLTTGLVWDTDRFGMNYFFHPYSGAGYFNAARSNGYSFFESVPFAFGGSLMWEYFGENTLPSVNDLINTTVTGAFLGEVSYKLSSDFLDDRTTGSERVFRELFAAAINPTRAFSRVLHGYMFRVTDKEVYHKEPLNMMFTLGARQVNEGRNFGTGSVTEMLTLHLDYGNPFEQRTRKVYDYFTLRANLSFGTGRKVIDNIIGQGILFGQNVESGNLEMLIGGFQHYDFWDNRTFELGTIAFGGGVISKLKISEFTLLFTDVHLGLVPLAGNSLTIGPDTSQSIDYNYGGGLEGKFETRLNLGGWSSFTMRGYYYWVHTYVGVKGDNYICILKPSVAVTLFSNISLGFEHLIYFSDRYPQNYAVVHDVRTEQKLFIQYYIDNFKHGK